MTSKTLLSLRVLNQKVYEVLRLNPQLRDYQCYFNAWSLDDL